MIDDRVNIVNTVDVPGILQISAFSPCYFHHWLGSLEGEKKKPSLSVGKLL